MLKSSDWPLLVNLEMTHDFRPELLIAGAAVGFLSGKLQ